MYISQFFELLQFSNNGKALRLSFRRTFNVITGKLQIRFRWPNKDGEKHFFPWFDDLLQFSNKTIRENRSGVTQYSLVLQRPSGHLTVSSSFCVIRKKEKEYFSPFYSTIVAHLHMMQMLQVVALVYLTGINNEGLFARLIPTHQKNETNPRQSLFPMRFLRRQDSLKYVFCVFVKIV